MWHEQPGRDAFAGFHPVGHARTGIPPLIDCRPHPRKQGDPRGEGAQKRKDVRVHRAQAAHLHYWLAMHRATLLHATMLWTYAGVASRGAHDLMSAASRSLQTGSKCHRSISSTLSKRGWLRRHNTAAWSSGRG